MLKRLVNEARFQLIIKTTGPLLIKSGYETVIGPNMTPVLTYRGSQQEVFMPGSSLKGVFRSHLEKIICSIKPQVVCDPFWRPSEQRKEAEKNVMQNLEVRERDYRISCGDEFKQRQKEFEERQREKRRANLPPLDDSENLAKRTEYIYSNSCPACRLFGSNSFIGRVSISDAYLVDPSKSRTERRDGVGIDRLTGGASHSAKFELQVVSEGVEFATTLYLRNFEMWQLGMLFLVVQDMEDELIRIGSGRSRGLGMINARIKERVDPEHPEGVKLSIITGGQEPLNELWGLGRWLDLNKDNSYGTFPDDFIVLSSPVERIDQGVRATRTFNGGALHSLRNTAVTQFITRIKNWQPRPAPEEAISHELQKG